MNDKGVIEAFDEVRDGRSPEFVICNPELNDQFLAAARHRGINGSDAEINRALLNLRKQNKLKEHRTTRRKKPDPNLKHYQKLVGNVARLVERQFGKTVDDVICDPNTRAQFDAMIQFLCTGTPSFEAEYAALSLRKSSQLKPEPVGQVIRAVTSKVLSISVLEKSLYQLPERPGVYLFFDENTTLYAGKADNLRARINEHVSTWSYREMIQQINSGNRAQAFVIFHELPITISARELAAYETELIRSRGPQHNRAGRTR